MARERHGNERSSMMRVRENTRRASLNMSSLSLRARAQYTWLAGKLVGLSADRQASCQASRQANEPIGC